jgi:hypothetical protein
MLYPPALLGEEGGKGIGDAVGGGGEPASGGVPAEVGA